MLTNIEKEMIRTQILAHADPNDANIADVDYLLRFWRQEKGLYLINAFGGDLILSKEMTYQEPLKMVINRMYNVYNEYLPLITNIREKFVPYLNKYYNTEYSQRTTEIIKGKDIFDVVQEITGPNCLAANVIDLKAIGIEYLEVCIPLGDKILKVRSGDRPIRVLKKICDFYGFSGFEDFRIAHSMALNTKTLHGTLNLSIHPLDYITMSDNRNNWSSCMSWEDHGEYRQGTVEMMNSPCVVIGYLSSDSGTLPIGNETWNSKKWRCLFIVNNDVVVSIRQYPYECPGLEEECVNWLGQLMGFGPDSEARRINSNNFTNLVFKTDYMYNDMDCGYDHYILANSYGDYSFNSNETMTITYSGTPECMKCGRPVGGSNEYQLCCDDCVEPEYAENCCICGAPLLADDVYWARWSPYCEHCCSEHLNWDEINDTYIPIEDSKVVYLANSVKDVKILEGNRTDLRSFVTSDDTYLGYYLDVSKLIEIKGGVACYDADIKYYVIRPEDCYDRGFNLFGFYFIADRDKRIGEYLESVKETIQTKQVNKTCKKLFDGLVNTVTSSSLYTSI